MPEWDDSSPSTGVIWDEPSPVQLLNSTKEGSMRRMFRQIAGQVAAEVSGPSKALASDVPLVNVSPQFLQATSPILRMLPKPVSEGATEAGAGVLSSMTAPSALRLGALVPISPAVAAAGFAGMGAYGAGQSLGRARVAQRDLQGDERTKEISKNTVEGLAALAQVLPLLGLKGGRPQTDSNLVKLPGEEPGVVSPPKVESQTLEVVPAQVPLTENPQAIVKRESQLPPAPETAITSNELPKIPPPSPDPVGLLGDADSPIPKEIEPFVEKGILDPIKEVFNSVLARTLPRTSVASKRLASSVIKYGNAEKEAKALAQSMATDVMGELHKPGAVARPGEAPFSQRLADVLIEGRLRTQGKSSLGREWTSLKDERDYVNALSDPMIKRAIENHKKTVQDFAEQQHTKLGGSLAPVDPVTGAFANLEAILGEDVPAERMGRTSGLEEPLKKSSRFSKMFKGTAEKYQNDYRHIAERMIGANYQEAMKQSMYDVAVKEGLARWVKKGEVLPEGHGEPLTVTRKGVPRVGEDGEITGANTYVKKIVFRKDIDPEIRSSMKLDQAKDSNAVTKALELSTKAQTSLGVDAVVHGAQLLYRLSNAERPSGLQGLGLAATVPDSFFKLIRNVYREKVNSSQYQREIAQMMNASPGPSYEGRGGPFTFFLKKVDRAARVSLNEMFNGLVKKGVFEDTTLNRERFLSTIGQYNKRLRSQFDNSLKDWSIAPFVVAGRTMNANALKQAMLMPGAEAKNAKAAWKLRALKASGYATTLGVTVPVINAMLNKGNVFGPTGTPLGAIGWDDKEGKLHTFDAAKLMQLRRPITGLGALERGRRQGKALDETLGSAAKDMFKGFAHPYLGPGINSLKMLGTGSDVLGYEESDRPDEFGSNAKAALKGLNPTIKAAMEGSSMESYSKAIGVAEPKLTAQDQAKRVAEGLFRTRDLNKLSPAERLQVNKENRELRAPADLVEQRKRAEFALRQDFASRERVQSGLSKENQAFLEKHKLTLSEEYAKRSIEEKNKGLYTLKERAFLEERLTTNYDRALARLSGQQDFDKLTQAQKQNRVKGILRGAYQVSLADMQKARKSGAFSK